MESDDRSKRLGYRGRLVHLMFHFAIQFATQVAPQTLLPLLPENTVLPVITGTPSSGQTLSGSDGTWLNSPSSFTYQWYSVDPLTSGGVLVTYNGEAIWVGAATNLGTAATQLLGAPQVGKLIGFTVTATNASGSRTASAVLTAIVT